MSQLPFQIKPVSGDEDRLLRKFYKGYSRSFVRAGPYLMHPGYVDLAEDFYNLEVRADDLWVVSFSRSGTTWLQELVWLVNNNLDFETAKNNSLTTRYAFVEFPMYAKTSLNYTGPKATEDDITTLPNMSLSSPRYLKCHLPMSLLPPKLLTAKVFYVARDPRDVAVSNFFMHKLFRYFDESVELKDYWDLFQRNLLSMMPVISHVDEAWKKRDHPNLTFIFYEEMQKDLESVIDRVCSALGKEYTAAQKVQLAQHLNFESMKKSNTINTGLTFKDNELTFLRKAWIQMFDTNKHSLHHVHIHLSSEREEVGGKRKRRQGSKFSELGKSGNWVNYFDDQMTKEAEEYMQKYLQHTDLKYLEYSN